MVTALLALSSLIVALIRIRRQARKDRIDVYFQALLKIRQQIVEAEIPKNELHDQIIELQHTVTNLVSEERISADNAFVGFIELSNQILQETR